ncbi:protein phosphatase 2C domain-containing protein [Streptomyces sp. NPDC048272]|uniref:protein phosphatase 2C domain-containing protein n=1 Tax=Streptomyces sp. NPDC048272 TaxID=3154616 RepID=UPI00343FB3BC
MSQRGADDWWQKLYEDPDAVPEPDPGDTLDQRYRSAVVLVKESEAGAGPGAAPGPGPVDTAAPSDRAGAVLPAQRREAEPEREPAGAGPRGADTPLPPPPPPPVPPPPPPLPPPPPPPAYPPPPAMRDPRTAGATGYALGDVVVPPAEPEPAWTPEPAPPARPPEPPELPVRGRGVGLREEPPSAAPAPAAEPVRETSSAAGPAPAGEPAPQPPREPRPLQGAPADRPEVRHLGDRAPTYNAEPGALPPADPAALDTLTPDTVLEGARHGTYTLRAASLRGDSARFRGEARRDSLLTARFGSGDAALVLVVLAGGDRAAPGAKEAAAELCHAVAAAVGRSHERLSDDVRAGRREALRSGLQRLTDRGYGRLRARAAELGHPEESYTAGLRGVLLPVDPQCRNRVCFGAGAGGVFRLRTGRWQDLEPGRAAGPGRTDPGEGSPEAGGSNGFLFRASVARPGDTLLLCSGGLADPMREEGLLSAELAARWSEGEPPGLAAFLADAQLRLKGYADDRTAAAVWEA